MGVILTAKAQAAAAATAANEAALAFSKGLAAVPVHDTTWRAMWDAAREFAAVSPDHRHGFPSSENEATCPLCDQDLRLDAAGRIRQIDAFVSSNLQKHAEETAKAAKQLLNDLPVLPAKTDWLAHFSGVQDAESPAIVLWERASARLAEIPKLGGAQAPPDLDTGSPVEALDAQGKVLADERVLLTAAQGDEERKALAAELLELRARAWCSSNAAAILQDLTRKKKLALLETASKLTNTSALTKKNADVVREELTGGYQNRFADELKALGATRLPVKPMEASSAKAKVKFALEVDGAQVKVKPSEILSEGEARIAALASFLADVTASAAADPFVFDDPISSLDADFEERVVQRLLTLAETRQVLVFTHRLSLQSLLVEGARKKKKAQVMVAGAQPFGFKAISLHRLGSKIGLVTSANILENDIPKGLKGLIKERLVRTAELADGGNVDEYEIQMKAICSDLRILAERCVEEVLLNAVVKRFRRAIMTMNKLDKLARISVNDCDFIDDLMTRYSCFEHSQPTELPTVVPEQNQVEEDAIKLLAWLEEFKERKITS